MGSQCFTNLVVYKLLFSKCLGLPQRCDNFAEYGVQGSRLWIHLPCIRKHRLDLCLDIEIININYFEEVISIPTQSSARLCKHQLLNQNLGYCSYPLAIRDCSTVLCFKHLWDRICSRSSFPESVISLWERLKMKFLKFCIKQPVPHQQASACRGAAKRERGFRV